MSVVQVSANPVKESRAGTGLAADGGSVVLEAAHGTNVNVTCSDSRDGRGGVGKGTVDGSREQLAQNGKETNTLWRGGGGGGITDLFRNEV